MRDQPVTTYEPHAFVYSEMKKGSVVYCGYPGCGRPQDDQLHYVTHKEGRIERIDMLMSIAEIIRKRSTCVRGKVGVVIARESRIISMGYNGAPPGSPHCLDIGCDVIENDHVAGCQRTIHAESNAIAWAARAGIATEDAVMYSTHAPCLKCAQLIVSAGITCLWYARDYRLQRLDILDQSNVVVRKYTPIIPSLKEST